MNGEKRKNTMESTEKRKNPKKSTELPKSPKELTESHKNLRKSTGSRKNPRESTERGKNLKESTETGKNFKESTETGKDFKESTESSKISTFHSTSKWKRNRNVKKKMDDQANEKIIEYNSQNSLREPSLQNGDCSSTTEEEEQKHVSSEMGHKTQNLEKDLSGMGNGEVARRERNNLTVDEFRELPKYHDRESYYTQLHHKIGTGLFVTDDIEDLPPRYQRKVIKKYDELKAYEKHLLEVASVLQNSTPSSFQADRILDGSVIHKNDTVYAANKEFEHKHAIASQEAFYSKKDKSIVDDCDTLSVSSSSSLIKNRERKGNESKFSSSLKKFSPKKQNAKHQKSQNFEHSENYSCDNQASNSCKYYKREDSFESFSKTNYKSSNSGISDNYSRNSAKVDDYSHNLLISKTSHDQNYKVLENASSGYLNQTNSTRGPESRQISLENKSVSKNQPENFQSSNFRSKKLGNVVEEKESYHKPYFDTHDEKLGSKRNPYLNKNQSKIRNSVSSVPSRKYPEKSSVRQSQSPCEENHKKEIVSSGYLHNSREFYNSAGCKCNKQDKFSDSNFRNTKRNIDSKLLVAERNRDSFPENSLSHEKTVSNCHERDKNFRKSAFNEQEFQTSLIQEGADKNSSPKKISKSNFQGSYSSQKEKNSEKECSVYPKSEYQLSQDTLNSNCSFRTKFKEKFSDKHKGNIEKTAYSKQESQGITYAQENIKNLNNQMEISRNSPNKYERTLRVKSVQKENTSNHNSDDQFLSNSQQSNNFERKKFKCKNENDPEMSDYKKSNPRKFKDSFSASYDNAKRTFLQDKKFKSEESVISERHSARTRVFFSKSSDAEFKNHNIKENSSSYENPCPEESTFHTPSSRKNIPPSVIDCKISKIGYCKINSIKSKEDETISLKYAKPIRENGFFIHITVSENSDNLELWQIYLNNILQQYKFELNFCCKFKESLTLSFQRKEHAKDAYWKLRASKLKNKDINKPHIISLSQLKTQLIKPCKCEINILDDSYKYINELSNKYLREHWLKMEDINKELKSMKSQKPNKFSREHSLSLEDALSTLRDMETVFQEYVNGVKHSIENIKNMSDLRKLKASFCRECNSFGRCLPIYSRKNVILNTVKVNPVSVVVAETGSGKSTQLIEYLLQSVFADHGTIICTQPRKIAAISIAQFVSKQIGSTVGKEIGYDVGIERKFDSTTKIIYMTDYALLRKCLRNRNLKGISYVIIDEAHERTLYTDLVLGLIKQCIPARPDFRVIITSATINPSVFIDYFQLKESAVIYVPGRAFPVEVVWLNYDVSEGFEYVNKCAELAAKLHEEESKGDILVFLTSPAEIDEAILLFQDMCSEDDMPELMSLHGKSDVQEQMQVFQTNSSKRRRIIFATNSAETSLTIPGVKYVIDSGMAKEMIFYPEKNKSCLRPSLINKSSAEQRKGRAGRTQPGVCYRLYSKKNFDDMPERSLPELLKTNLLCALLKVYEFGIKPRSFDFVEAPPPEAITRSLDSLEMLELVENNELTKLGQQVVQLSIEPRLAKFVLLGVECGIGHEAAIIAALVSEAGRIFLRFEDNKVLADQKKKIFCQKQGDLCTFLEIYKRWLEVSRPERLDWCVSNYISSKALLSAAKSVKEILITLRLELGISVSKRYNNLSFKTNFEEILFSSFSENLCVFAGHHQLGYYSPYFKESLFIHPSSALKYLRLDPPKFLVYTTLMETSRNFILDVTPIKEDTIHKAYQRGSYKLPLSSLKLLQISPITLGPFGEKLLTRHILGKGGSVISDLEFFIEKITKSRNFRLDVCVDKGQIVIYAEDRFHEKITKFMYDVVNQARSEMAKEEKVVKMGEFSSISLSSGGRIHDVIIPGEFRELSIKPLDKSKVVGIETLLKELNSVQSLEVGPLKNSKNKHFIHVTFKTVYDAQRAHKYLLKKKIENVQTHIFVPEMNRSAKPLYRINLTWPRLLCKGNGFVEFSSRENCILASGKLSSKSFFIGENYVDFQPSKHSELLLALKNLPPVVDEETLKKKIVDGLPDFLRNIISKVQVNRRESLSVVEADLSKIKDHLYKSFREFTPSSKLMIDLVRPKATSVKYEAWAYFVCPEAGKLAFEKLKENLTVNAIPVEMTEVIEASIQCQIAVYEFLKEKIHNLITKHKGKIISLNNSHRSDEEEKLIKFSSSKFDELEEIRNSLLKLIQSRRVDCHNNLKYFYFFTDSGKRKLSEIQNATKTLIVVDPLKKVLFIYGDDSKKCYEAELDIHFFITNFKITKTKMFDLKNPDLPSGFLKQLITKFGLDLYGLVCKFDLKSAKIDTKLKTLFLEGQSSRLREVEEYLEKICIELYKKNPNKTIEDGNEICAICLDLVSFDCYRLESCGHAFCKSCLLMQLECKIIPVTCAQENCGKELFIIDIDRILSLGGDQLKKEFYLSALQYHVSSNPHNIRYCPFPDCCFIYRISSKSNTEYICPGCLSEICTYCRTFAHKGMSCEIFQGSKSDEDYSLKVYMKENERICKQCPNCKTALEKFDGCNHVECLNCKAHLCWLCLKIFPSAALVYDHQPYCPNNQTNAA